MPKISVIVPVYKVEDYLDRCVESILAQTFVDFELILVDDGSPDNCPAMCDSWAGKDSRIKVIHKENGGLSDARNAGFEGSCGEWITFIDSDDYVHPEMLEALLNAVLQTGTIVSVGGLQVSTTNEFSDQAIPSATIVSSESVFLSAPRINDMSACGKLYHRRCFNNIRYPKGKLNEDAFVTYRILYNAMRIAVIDGPLYYYFQSSQSITRSEWTRENLDELEAYYQQINFFREKNLEKIYNKKCCDFLVVIRRQILQLRQLPSGDIRRHYERILLRQLRNTLRNEKALQGLDKKERWKQYMFAYPILGKSQSIVYATRITVSALARKILGNNAVDRLKNKLMP